ncbi:MAG: 3-isopropylmalate dehydratase small subunit [Candidatus Latescibacteria bacterium]|nr:3-isopropylmalate dehydratase small subunit [Candidatus Latescibacterota bacterium]
MKGKAHVYKRNHINTDEIIPARYLVTDDEHELALHAMESIDPDFVKKVQPGDIIVAGGDFGCGSSREHAVWALRGAGVACVIADSFARIFFRNAVNNGFPVVELEEITVEIENGDELEVNLREGILKNNTKGKELSFTPLPDFAFKIADAGGLLQSIKK